ncbi:Aste57867_14816 [Aphanomyces stellatus]|uniref:Aste57867_14816 protein n=1 Tax=Aphanomyces stellatus TaxID=120398 RepID=A0A485L281_9STRA|nr:hypothetical protein As57867_014760 [Aphanomyces stellatus]VFT91634.1 Aste57867_14816 [Aphanomyces stellatus]
MPSMMRTFMSHPTLSADWSGDYEEKSAEWFELFLDLIVVAAFSNTATKLQHDLSLPGVLYFLLLTGLYTMCWTLYANFHARFNEKSLLHYAYLYVFLVGLGGMVLAGDAGHTFTIGLVLVHIAQVLMYSTVHSLLPRVRATTVVDILFNLFAIAVLLLSLVLPASWTLPAYVLVYVVESIGRYVAAILGWFMPPSHMRVPMNIDHFNERVGCLVMVALGEAVVSAIINFDKPELLTTRFFVMMQLALLVIFAMAMYYFAIKPPRDFHALRRSAVAGITFTWLHFLLYPTLLAIGVGLKFITAAVLADTPLRSIHVWLLFGSIALALVVMLGIRLTHYGGRQPSPTDPVPVKRIKNAWWLLVGVSPLVSLLCAALLVAFSGDDATDPLHALTFAALFNVFWVLVESAMMNKLVELGYGGLGAEDGEAKALLDTTSTKQ